MTILYKQEYIHVYRRKHVHTLTQTSQVRRHEMFGYFYVQNKATNVQQNDIPMTNFHQYITINMIKMINQPKLNLAWDNMVFNIKKANAASLPVLLFQIKMDTCRIFYLRKLTQ